MSSPSIPLKIGGLNFEAHAGELLVDALNRSGRKIPQVCYHPQLGPIETCDTCMVEIDGKLVRACATRINEPVAVLTESKSARDAQLEAFDRILANHLWIGSSALISRSPTKSTIQTRSTATIRINASSAAVASRLARTSR